MGRARALGSVAVLVWICLLAVQPAAAAARSSAIVVCPECPVSSIEQAVSGAVAGARIEVEAGVYPGSLTIDKPVTLIGHANPVIAGNGSGTVVHIVSSGVTIDGFTITGSGTSLDREDTAVLVDAPDASILNNVIDDSLFGVYLKQSSGSVIRGNVVHHKPLPIALRGDGIRVWYSDDVTIADNTVRDGRDVILWYSNRGIVQGNTFDRGRYGLHLMFSDSARIEGNSLRSNTIGLFIMYSREPYVVGNTMSDNHGASGGGLGLKDVDRAVIEANRFVHNRIAAQVDTSPREMGIENYFRDNVFAFNEVGIGFMPAVRHNTLTGNVFIDNTQQVAILGGGELRDITWADAGRGNYWSDYAGYDANSDGIGDLPYRSQRLFESLTDRHPALRLFLFSPAAMAVDFAARAVPSIRPEIRFSDPSPLMSPALSSKLPPTAARGTGSRIAMGALGSMFIVAVPGFLAGVRRRRGSRSLGEGVVASAATDPSAIARAAISAHDVTKSYGATRVVHGVTFDAARGEAIALWGPNGSGKTTVIRCLLGLARFDGTLKVCDVDPRVDGRGARRRVGYVPQDLPESATPVHEIVSIIATLKGAPIDSAMEHLATLGLTEHAGKPVSELSGGMRQRLALALALIGAPDILLLDEPTANLDARGRAEVLDLLLALKRRGMTLVFSTHRADDIQLLADRVVMLEPGSSAQVVGRSEFQDAIESGRRLILRLSNGHREAAVSLLTGMGCRVSGDAGVLAIEMGDQQKARVLREIIRSGVDIDDFEWERQR